MSLTSPAVIVIRRPADWVGGDLRSFIVRIDGIVAMIVPLLMEGLRTMVPLVDINAWARIGLFIALYFFRAALGLHPGDVGHFGGLLGDVDTGAAGDDTVPGSSGELTVR